jgi:copper chaperone CopZ
MTITYKAPEIECDGCAKSIKKALSASVGVRTATVDVAEKTVTIEYDDDVTSEEALAETLDDIGFPVTKV